MSDDRYDDDWDDDNECPCYSCRREDSCDNWEAMFCCSYCQYLYGDDTPCDTCDPWDI